MQMLDRIRWCCTGDNPAKPGPAEYWGLISSEMNVLYVLSFLLTAQKEKAELCLEQTLDEFIEGEGDFIEWACARGRQALLEHALYTMKPDATDDEMDFSDGLFSSNGRHLFGSIALLPAFERFVFVMTTIYGKSDTECARLLGATRCKVTIARELTEQVLFAKQAGSPPDAKPFAAADSAYVFNTRCSNC